MPKGKPISNVLRRLNIPTAVALVDASSTRAAVSGQHPRPAVKFSDGEADSYFFLQTKTLSALVPPGFSLSRSDSDGYFG
jgi:hypothetical protein